MLGDDEAEQFDIVESNPRDYRVAPGDLVFTLQNGDPMLPQYDADLWRALAEKAGVDHSRIYRARHTAITYLLQQGAQRSRFHSPPATTTPASRSAGTPRYCRRTPQGFPATCNSERISIRAAVRRVESLQPILQPKLCTPSDT
jgi:integrase